MRHDRILGSHLGAMLCLNRHFYDPTTLALSLSYNNRHVLSSTTLSKHSWKFNAVVHIRRVLMTLTSRQACCSHLCAERRIILGDSATLVAPESIASQKRKLRIQSCLYLISLL